MTGNLNNFTNLFSLNKTLRFSLKPIGKTKAYVDEEVIRLDKILAEKYGQAKKIIDEYHKYFINRKLQDFSFEKNDLEKFSELYNKTKQDKSVNNDQINFNKHRDKLRKKISKELGKGSRLFKKELIREDLIPWLENNLEKNNVHIEGIENPQEIIKSFYNWTTYFDRGFNESRKNIYTDKPHSTSIAYRLIHENLPRFIDNISRYKKSKELKIDFSEVEKIFKVNLDDFFSLDHFNKCLTQEGIDKYNTIRGGQSSFQSKEQGLNEKINLHAQQLDKQKQKKIQSCQIEELYKQILGDRDIISFREEDFNSDASLCMKIKLLFRVKNNEIFQNDFNITKILNKILIVFNHVDPDKIYIRNDRSIADISKNIFDDWSIIKESLKYYSKQENKKKDWIKRPCFSFSDIQNSLYAYFDQYKEEDLAREESKDFDKTNIKYLKEISSQNPLLKYFKNLSIDKNTSESLTEKILKKQIVVDPVLRKYEEGKDNEKISDHKEDIQVIKSYLDVWMDLIHFFKPLYLKNKNTEEMDNLIHYDKDSGFYNDFNQFYEIINPVISLYNRTRNYLTKKPYKVDKFKLNFNNQQLAGGWDENKLKDYGCTLFIKDKRYFLGVLKDTTIFKKKTI